MVYLFSSHSTEAIAFSSSRGFKVYSSNGAFNGKRLEQPQQMMMKLSGEEINGIDAGNDVKTYEASLEARVHDNDDRFFHEYPVSFVSSMKDETFDMHAYMDVEFPQNVIDISEIDEASMNSVNNPTSRVAAANENPRDFHYPEVGYRYYGILKGSQIIPNHKLTSQQNNTSPSVNVPSTSLKNNPEKYLPNRNVTKSNSVPSKTSSASKSRKNKRPFSDLLPPPPDNEANNQTDRRYLVYLCDTQYLCGGWGDRQRGIVSTYLLARLAKRQLKIVMTTPCNLRFFYKPNKVQWLPDLNELVTNSNITINALLDKSFQFSLMDGDFNTKFPQKVIYLKTNQDYFSRLNKNPAYSRILDQWGGLYVQRSRFHWAWNDIMQPSHRLLTHLQYIVGSQFLIRKGLISKPVKMKTANSTTAIGNSTLICAHVRMGKNPTIPMDEDLQSFSIEHLPTLLKFMASKDTKKNAKFFVATDYEHVRTESKKFFGNRLLDYGGKILHIDRQRSEHSACVGFEVALIDQFILSLCDILIVCKSGFSINASFMSNSTGHVFYMKDGKIEQIKN